MNLNRSLGLVSQKVKEYLEAEHTEGGLLEDVNTIIQVSQNDAPIDEPAVWIVQHPTVLSSNKGNLGHVAELLTPFEFACFVYHPDLEESFKMGQDLATRVGVSILKNFMKNNTDENGQRIFTKIDFQEYLPVGEVSIEGKAEKVSATSIVFNFKHEIDWLKCCNKESK